MTEQQVEQKWKNRIVKFDFIDPNKIKINPLNPKEHPKKQRQIMSGILDDIGWTDTVTINITTGNLVDGEMRVTQAIASGEKLVPVIYVELSEEEEKKMLLTFNQVSYLSVPLAERIEAINKTVNISNEEVKKFLDSNARKSGLKLPDDLINVVDFPIKDYIEEKNDFNVELGQLWEIESNNCSEKHRLFCGDCSNFDNIQFLMGDKKCDLFFTDPPYNINYNSIDTHLDSKEKVFDYIANDNTSRENFSYFIRKVLSEWKKFFSQKTAVYLCSPMLYESTVIMDAMINNDILINRQIVWKKETSAFGRGHYHWIHEIIYYGWVKGNVPEFYQTRNQNTVWEISRDTKFSNYIHPTQKPVELFAIPIKNHTLKNSICAEPFAGSGSQYIAAEQLGRVVYGMELDLKYCNLILSRLKSFGLNPVLVGTIK